MKPWLIGLANAAVSGAAGGIGGLAVGVDFKHSLIILGISAGVSLAKWMAQHPIPGGAQ